MYIVHNKLVTFFTCEVTDGSIGFILTIYLECAKCILKFIQVTAQAYLLPPDNKSKTNTKKMFLR